MELNIKKKKNFEKRLDKKRKIAIIRENEVRRRKGSSMINSVFGFGLWYESCSCDSLRTKLCVYVSDKKVWEEEKCCSDYTNEEEGEVLWRLGLGEEMEAVFTLLDKQWDGSKVVPVEKITKEEIHKKLIEAGFTYDKKFEDFMKEYEE